MESNIDADGTRTFSIKPAGSVLPHSAQAAACQCSTKPATKSSQLGLDLDDPDTAKVLLAMVLGFMMDPMIGSDKITMTLSSAARYATKMGVDEARWEEIFQQVVKARKAWHQSTPWGEFMG
jgi:hypothetical protein